MRSTIALTFLAVPLFTITGCGQVDITSAPTVSSSIDVNQAVTGSADTAVTSSLASQSVPTTTLDILSAPTASFVPPTSTAISQNNPATWPRHYFKELGFSIKLPFATGSIETGFAECVRGNLSTSSTFIRRVCDDADHYSYWYSALLRGKNNDYIFLGSVSEYYADGGEWGLTKLHDFTYKGLTVLIGQSIIHPLKILFFHGMPIIIFDPNKDIYGIFKAGDDQIYAAIFKLPNNKKFKAAALQFYASDLNFEQFTKAINTIQFSQ